MKASNEWIKLGIKERICLRLYILSLIVTVRFNLDLLKLKTLTRSVLVSK